MSEGRISDNKAVARELRLCGAKHAKKPKGRPVYNPTRWLCDDAADVIEGLIKTLTAQRVYLGRLKHRAKVRGGPDVSAMAIADEAIERLDDARKSVR